MKILNIEVNSIKKVDLLKELKSGVLFTPNVDHLIKLQKDKDFYDVYKKAEWVICDSKILYMFSKLLNGYLPMAIPGSSFFADFYEYHRNDVNCRIFLLGAADGIAVKAMDNINKKIGRMIVVGAHSPSFGFENKDEECYNIVNIINRSNANVLVVGVGAPKQEKWIMHYRNSMPNINVFMGLGATIDFEAGILKRAPKLFQKIGLEWFYRFIKEPRRLFKRYFIDDICFFYYFILQLLGLYKDPFENK